MWGEDGVGCEVGEGGVWGGGGVWGAGGVRVLQFSPSHPHPTPQSKKNPYLGKSKPMRKPKKVFGRVFDRMNGFRKYLFGFRAFGNPWVFQNTDLNTLKVFSDTLILL